MSGPKTITYSLAKNREAERKRREEDRRRVLAEQERDLEREQWRWRARSLHQQALSLQLELGQLQAQRPDMQIQVPAIDTPPPLGDSSTLQTYVATTSTKLQEMRRACSGLRSRVGLSQAMGATRPVVQPQPRTVDEVLGGAKGESSPALDSQSEIEGAREVCLQAVYEFMTYYRLPLPGSVSDLVAKLNEEDEPGKVWSLALQLRQALSDEARMIDREREQARRWFEELDPNPQGLEEARLVGEQLQAVARGEARLDDGLRQAVADVRCALAEQERGRQERAADILRKAFEELGYEVQGIASTLFVDGGRVYLHKSVWPGDRLVRLQVAPEKNEIDARLVALDNGDSGHDDADLERGWCDDLSRALLKMNEEGLSARVEKSHQPGAERPPHINPQTLDPHFLEKIKEQEADRRPPPSLQVHQHRKA